MKLQKFEKKDIKNKKIIILSLVGIFLLVIGFVIFKTYAFYEENKAYNILKGNIPNFIPYTEEILNGADPVLGEGLVPITLEEDGTVRRANLAEEWYSYEDKVWANAVILENSYDVLNLEGNIRGATKNDGYASLDGVDDQIDLELANYEFTNGMSVSIRFRLNSETSGQEFFGNLESAGFGCGYYSSKKFICMVWNSTTSSYVGVSDTKNVEIGKYYTLTFTYDHNEMKLYIDGKLVSSKVIGVPYKKANAEITIGANPKKYGSSSLGSSFANMDVEEAVIYDRVLGEEEVAKNFADKIKIYNEEGLLRHVDFTNDGYYQKEYIQEENIESYFVWIPRYKYKIWDEGNYSSLTTIDTEKVHTIQVEFETKDVAASTGSTTNSWLTHPAFTSFDVNGLWVGKFESGYKGSTSSSTALSNTNEPDKLQIKPNVNSWRDIQPANMHLTSYNYKRELDSHMMKNTEWGAVAYLHHSAYGSQQGVRINNNSAYLTGYAAVNELTTGYTQTNISCSETPESCNEYGTDSSITQSYNTSTGYLASTTGNISGVYDMSGGTYEYVMGVIADSEGNPVSGRHNIYNSGFNGTYSCSTCDSTLSGIDSSIKENTDGIEWPESKYYDLYTYQTGDLFYKNRILGDATGEMGPFSRMTYDNETRYISSWHDDEGWFIVYTGPWFLRGGNHTNGIGAGIFAFARNYGRSGNWVSFRVVLAI